MSDETMTHACAPAAIPRRGLLGFALALTAAPAIAAAPSSLMTVWRDFAQTSETYNREWREPHEAALLNRLHELEQRLLDAPISSKDDVIAKLLMVGISLDRGNRSDDRDQLAYDTCAAWMEAR